MQRKIRNFCKLQHVFFYLFYCVRIIAKCLNRQIYGYHTKVAWVFTHTPVTSVVRPASNNWQLGASPPDCRRLDFIIINSTSTDWTENIRILFTFTVVGLMVIYIRVNSKYSMIHIIHQWWSLSQNRNWQQLESRRLHQEQPWTEERTFLKNGKEYYDDLLFAKHLRMALRLGI